MITLAADGGPLPAPAPRLGAVSFREAIAWANARQVVLPDVYFGDLQGLARSMAFSIAGIAQLDQLQAVKDSLAAATASGETLRDWQRRVRSGKINLDLPAHRLENIYRTNIQGHYARGRCEQQKRNTESHPWYMLDAVNDSRTRPAHAAMDGKVARHDDPWWDTNTPPNGYQCFLPGTRVQGDFQIGLKAWYSGRAVEIVTTHGNRLPITANHPILTSHGWVKASQLKEGDNLLRYQSRVDDGVGALAVSPDGTSRKIDDEQHPPTAEQVFDALAAQRFGRADRAAFNLYGDALNFKGHVQVVGAASELMDGVYSDGMQRSKNSALNGGNHNTVRPWDEQLNTAGASFPAAWLKVMAQVFQSLFDKRFRHANGVCHFLATVPLIKSLRQLAVKVRNAPLFGAFPGRTALALNRMAIFFHGAPLQRFGFAAPTQGDTLTLQPISNGLTAGAKSVGNELEAFTADISGDQVRRIGRVPSGGLHRAAEHDGISILRRAAFHSVVAQQSREQAVTDVALFEQLAHCCAGLIERDQVISVRHFAFSGHVYDFQTANGLIAANSITCANCRCRIIALSDKQASHFRTADAKRMQDSELAAARAAAQPDKGWDYSVCAEPDEGIRRAIEAKRKTADHRLMGVLDSAIWQEAQRVAVIAIAINPPVTAASAANEIQAWKDRLADLPQTEPEVIAAMDQADEWIAAAEARERDQ